MKKIKNDHRVLISMPKELHDQWNDKYSDKISFSAAIRGFMSDKVLNNELHPMELEERFCEWLEDQCED